MVERALSGAVAAQGYPLILQSLAGTSCLFALLIGAKNGAQVYKSEHAEIFNLRQVLRHGLLIQALRTSTDSELSYSAGSGITIAIRNSITYPQPSRTVARCSPTRWVWVTRNECGSKLQVLEIVTPRRVAVPIKPEQTWPRNWTMVSPIPLYRLQYLHA